MTMKDMREKERERELLDTDEIFDLFDLFAISIKTTIFPDRPPPIERFIYWTGASQMEDFGSELSPKKSSDKKSKLPN